MLTLGIETSCDETGLAVTDGRKVLSNVVTSSVHLHKRYGGVVPEIASRYHVEYIVEVMNRALKDAGRKLKDMRLVSVTNGPGLVGALLVGISFAKSLAYVLGAPLIGVNHVSAHLYSAFLNEEGERPEFPFVGLVVSGGHTALFSCRGVGRQTLLGQTQDDAAGEAYDKVSKLLGLGYPGGPAIEKMAKLSKEPDRVKFPKSFMGKDSLDFSFSGLKTAVLYRVQKILNPESEIRNADKGSINDICYAFQETALDMVVDNTCRAAERTGFKNIVVGGGVAANSRLRHKLKEAAARAGAKVYFPDIKYCLDNGAMIAFLGEALYRNGRRPDIYLSAEPNLEVGNVK